MRNPMNDADRLSLEMIEEEIEESRLVGAWPSWMKLSPVSEALGNKGAVCTGTIECQSNCN